MLKKMAFFVLAMAVVLGSVGIASAAQNVANTNQKGSLLIWPLIQLAWDEPEGYTEAAETWITIGNDYYTEVWVKCYWVDRDQEIQDFLFRITPNQPVWFNARTGEGTVSVPPFMATHGELKCWAVNANGDKQIAFNHLYGSAIVMITSTGFEYNAWSFTARGVKQGDPVGTIPGKLELTGVDGGYDACPQYLVENFIAYQEGPPEFEPTLALVPCKQDLRQDRTPTCTKAKFDVWNENETKYTGAYRCIKCWFEGELGEIDIPGPPNGYGYGRDKFTKAGLHTWLARFRVTGVASTVCVNKFKTPDTVYGPGVDKCKGGQVNSPLIGVLWHEFEFGDSEFNIGITPHTAGFDGTGFVWWDPQGEPPPAPAN